MFDIVPVHEDEGSLREVGEVEQGGSVVDQAHRLDSQDSLNIGQFTG